MSSDEEIDVTSVPLAERIQNNKIACLGARCKSSNPKHSKNLSKKKSSRTSRKHSHLFNILSDEQWPVPDTPKAGIFQLSSGQSHRSSSGNTSDGDCKNMPMPLTHLPACISQHKNYEQNASSRKDLNPPMDNQNPYFLGSKKRQNGDRIGQIATQSKRSCLSDRFLQPEWRSFRKKNGVVDHASQSDGAMKNITLYRSCASAATVNSDDVGIRSRLMKSSLYPEEKYEKHSENSNPLSEIDGPSSSLGSSSSASNYKTHKSSNALRDCDYPLSLPSTSRGGQDDEGFNDVNSLRSDRGVRFIESDSDSDVSQSLHAAPLKGGRQFPEYFHRAKKVFGKKVQRILYSDDSSNDNEWQKKYHRPAKCLSSASEDSDDIPVLPRKKKFTKYAISQLSSSESNEDLADDNNAQHPRNMAASNSRRTASMTKHQSSKSGEQSKKQSKSSNDCVASGSTSNNSSQNTQNSTDNPFLAFRNRFSRNGGWARRSISPHPRTLTSQRHSGLTRSPFKLFKSKEHRLMGHFPDLFDVEDSSDVEFFTARSYSDTETSTESVGAANANNATAESSDARYNPNAAPAGSSDDEISIIFAANAASNGGTANRRGRVRGPVVRRRRTRGSGRTASRSGSQDVPPVSPDPVAQVRQVEEDERYARILQAEFDAEVNEAATFVSLTDSDESAIIDPVGLDPPTVPLPAAPRPSFTPYRPCYSPPFLIRDRARAGMHHNNVQIPGARRRHGRRNIQVPQGDPWMWQFARVLGLGPTTPRYHHHLASHEPEPNDYEALINLTESVGDAIPRGLRKNEINRLPTRRFYVAGCASTSQMSEEVVHKRTELNKECQVCLCDYENGDVLRILPCFHEFHTPCIDPWLKINHTCPVCRVEVAFGR